VVSTSIPVAPSAAASPGIIRLPYASRARRVGPLVGLGVVQRVRPATVSSRGEHAPQRGRVELGQIAHGHTAEQLATRSRTTNTTKKPI
jgi:hypothetical protein